MKKDYAKIAKKGEAIYEKIKAKYEPKHNGKFLVIEVESADVYLAKSSIEAIDLARKEQFGRMVAVQGSNYVEACSLLHLYSPFFPF